MKHALAGILGLALTGCAPTIPVLILSPDPAPVSPPSPASEIMNEEAVTPREGTGAIIVTGDGRISSEGDCTLEVALDDQLVAGIRPGERVVLFAEPGPRVVSLNVRDEGSCMPASAQVPLDIVAHTTQRIQAGSDSQYDLKVEVDSYGRSLPR
jgi:hypothetical protein